MLPNGAFVSDSDPAVEYLLSETRYNAVYRVFHVYAVLSPVIALPGAARGCPFVISYSLAKTSPQPPSHKLIIHHYDHMVEYAISQHHLSLADNYSNIGNRSG